MVQNFSKSEEHTELKLLPEPPALSADRFQMTIFLDESMRTECQCDSNVARVARQN
jgi:hypothetical protein